MKDSTKLKLKKVGKASLYGLGIVFSLLMGLVVGKCSADNSRNVNAEDVSQSPYEDVDLLGEYGSYYEGYVVGFSSPPNVQMSNQLSSWVLGFDHLAIGSQFAVVLPENATANFDIGLINNPVWGKLNTHITGDVSAGQVRNNASLREGVYLFSITQSLDQSYDALYIRGPSAFMPSVYLVTASNYYLYQPTIAQITLPTDFNPIWLYGDAYKGAVYGMLSVNAEGSSYTASLNVTFVSGGNVYDGIYFQFDHLANTWYQEPSNGQIVLADRYANDFHYPVGMYYRRFGETAIYPSINPESFDCVWSPQWGLTNDSEGNTHKYLTPIGSFASDAFRVIDVKLYDTSTPVSARWPNLDALALLQLKASGFIITGDTNLYDAFELLSGAFRSVASILNVQILPFMSLGMLVFIPLIVLVLFAIIRILNK